LDRLRAVHFISGLMAHRKLGGPKLAQARKVALETIGAVADNHAANVLPIIREIRKAGATTLREIADALMRAAWRLRVVGSGTRPR
jgi:hypothetical protein